MTTTMTPYDAAVQTGSTATTLRRVVSGAAAFDAASAVVCFAVASDIGSWLALPTGAVRATAAVFLAAAATGVWSLRRRVRDARPIAAVNAAFAAWCLVLLGTATPNVLGGLLLAGAAVTSAATAWLELRLARRS